MTIKLRETKRHKVLMIGVDAADIDFIRSSLIALPTFRRLLDLGVFFPLRSPAEFMPGSVWPTFYTGTMPGEHGISQHIQWDPDAMCMRRLSADWFYCEPFWYELERRGLRVAAVDVPFSFPSRLQRGVEIVNWGSHDLTCRFQVRPAHLRREIRRRFGAHPMGYEIPVDKTRRQLEVIRRELVAGARTKAKLSRWLMEQTQWDFFLTVFGECHRGGHILWRDPEDHHSLVSPEALLEVYVAVDDAIGHVLEGVDLATTTVIVFSLHGMGSNVSQGHFMRRVMDRINARYWAAAGHAEARSSPRRVQRRGVMTRLRESVPASLQHAVARAVPVEVRDWVVGQEVVGALDWSRTPGLAVRSDLNGFVRFNVVQRERDGVLKGDANEDRRYGEWVEKNFLALRAVECDAPVVRDVVWAHRMFPGPRRKLLPDLIVRWHDLPPLASLHSDQLGRIVGPQGSGRGGEHRSNGFAVLLGDKADDRRRPRLAHSVDFSDFVRHCLSPAGAQAAP